MVASGIRPVMPLQPRSPSARKTEALGTAERESPGLVVGEDGDDPRPIALDRRHPVRGVLALEGVEGAGLERKGLHALLLIGEQTGDPFVVRISLAPEGTSILELAARARRLEQDGGGELGPVEVPVELLPFVVGHDIDTPQRVLHRVQPGPPHHRRQEVDERLPRVDPGDDASRDLVPQIVWLMVVNRLRAGWFGARPSISSSK